MIYLVLISNVHFLNIYTIRFYSYVNRWDDLVTNETMMLIDLPGTLTEGEEAQTFLHNFYKIPLISNTAEPVMQRNTFYQVTATVDMLGTEEIDEPVTLQNVHFKTAEWVSSTIPVGEGDSPQYLILSEYHKDIRNADGFNEGDGLEFYSSSAIASVTVATSDEIADAIARGDITFNYPGEGNSVPGIFFVNKNNRRVSVDADDPNDDDSRWDQSSYNDKVEVSFDNGVVEGKIHLTSTNPENVTKRYITLKVMNEDGLSKYVVIEQYPLEYIQPIAGYYSYRDDFLSSSSATPSNEPCGYEAVFTTTSNRNPTQVSLTSGWTTAFQSKVFTDAIRTYSFTSTQSGSWQNRTYTWRAQASRSEYSLQNNMMYFVTITQTSDEYKLAHPLMEYDSSIGQMVAVSSSENDGLVSPQFMLASQLGAVGSNAFSTWQSAMEHCAYYVETYNVVESNGETTTYKLDDWRLPTSKELEIIVQFQNTASDVMDQVVAGDYYYISYQYGGNGGRGPGAGTASGTGVRCIRDVKPTDAFLQNTNQ